MKILDVLLSVRCAMKSRVVFSHIPKTAGTSLNFMLDRYFGSSHLRVIYRKGTEKATYRPQDLRKDLLVCPQAQLIAGHSLKPFVDFEEFSEKLEWFTFFRNPVDRYISHYVHQQTNSKRPRMDLYAWSKRYNRHNWCVRMIAGEEDLGKAKEFLESKFKFIGLTESFDDSVKMLKAAFNWEKFDVKLPQQKMIGRSNAIKDEIKDNRSKYDDFLHEQNALDIELYDYFIKHLWQKQRAALLSSDQGNEACLSEAKHKRNLLLNKMSRNLIYRPYVYLDKTCQKFMA